MHLPVLISGLHRSGTSLVVKLLNQTADVVALNEPMKVMRLAGLDRQEVYRAVDEFATQMRDQLRREGKVRTKHLGGEFADNVFADARTGQAVRPVQVSLGDVAIRRELPPDFTLAIKHNAAFAALAGWLSERYACYAIIRNPLPVLLSWRSVDIPAHQGFSPVASALDPALGRSLAAATDVLDRQVRLLNWFFRQYGRHIDPAHIIRYEALVTDPGPSLQVVMPSAGPFPGALASKNTNPLYDRREVRPIVRRLLGTGGDFLGFYDREEILAQESALLSTASDGATAGER